MPAALDDPGDVRVLVREVAVRQVDAGHLEEGDVLRPELDVSAGRIDEAGQEPRAEGRELDRDRLGELPRLRIRIVGPQRRRVRLGEPEAGQRVLDAATQPLDRRQRAEHRLPRRKREGDVLEPESRDLLDDVDLARDVPGAEGGRDDFTGATLEAEPLEPARLLVGRSLDSDDLVRALGPVGDDGPLREVALHVDVPDPLGAGRLDDQLRRELRRLVGEVRVDALLPAVRPLGSQAEALRGAVDPGRLEVRRLEEHVGRRLADLGLLAAHDPGDRDRPLGVRDHEVALLQLALDPVERLDHLRRAARAGR